MNQILKSNIKPKYLISNDAYENKDFLSFKSLNHKNTDIQQFI